MLKVYVLYSPNYDKIYIGQTNSLKLRLEEHNSGNSRYAKRYIPWKLVHYEKFATRSEAMKREKELKSHRGRDYIRKNFLSGRVRQLPD